MSANGWRIPQPQMGFYWNLPADAPSAFSKKREQRSISRGLAPKHRAIAWNDARVHAAATTLRAEHGDTVKTLVRPQRWEDLYQFFDTVDLWFEGSWNLWRVLHLLCDENDVAAQRDSLDSAILDEVERWAYKWCTHKTNRLKLATWDQKSDILSVLSESDSSNVAGCRKEALDMLRGALKYWHGHYKIPVPEQDGSKADAQQLDRLPENSPTAPKQIDLLPPPYIYTKNPNVVIVNGTTPVEPQQKSAGYGCSDGTASESFRRGHQPSKSGPVPAVPAGHFLTARGAGVENSGPSRLPKGPQQLSEIHENLPQASHAEKQPQVNPKSTATQNNIALHSSNGNSSIDNTAGSRTRPHVPRCQNSGIGVASSASSFAVCPCRRCMEASRSVHVGFIRVERSISNDKMCGILTEYFGRWGHVEGCEIRKSNAAVFCFAFVRYTSEQSALQAVAAANGQPINAPGLAGARREPPLEQRKLPSWRQLKLLVLGQHRRPSLGPPAVTTAVHYAAAVPVPDFSVNPLEPQWVFCGQDKLPSELEPTGVWK
ncbi:hypothetical protein NEMBOFW57_001848 [Staphylotrichum longicolle]|uniref:RRM domain-containing protein n=1 Tax=Staphylotrichum longicolle TaxID=669026 RepID=A0AAD4I178_9PEZI|nr:hypothetical protein NEMBOFW57_001848 [Staphylotrichum longicolle]